MIQKKPADCHISAGFILFQSFFFFITIAMMTAATTATAINAASVFCDFVPTSEVSADALALGSAVGSASVLLEAKDVLVP